MDGLIAAMVAVRIQNEVGLEGEDYRRWASALSFEDKMRLVARMQNIGRRLDIAMGRTPRRVWPTQE